MLNALTLNRSCLKEVPDNITFHLKRFEFDLTTFQRNKINDAFEFPDYIDLAPYKVDNLDAARESTGLDYFDLTGVLVHSGTSETGHYYSYIKSSDRDSTHENPRWVEFNDAEVTDFEGAKIRDACYGGPAGRMGVEDWQKPYNAYMLFYKRRSTPALEEPIDTGPGGSNSAVAPPKFRTLDPEIKHHNDLLIRSFCLLDQSQIHFMVSLFPKIKSLTNTGCSDTHDLEKVVVKCTLEYLRLIAAKSKDTSQFERLLISMSGAIDQCVRCCSFALEWFLGKPETIMDFLLRHPVSKQRSLVAQLFIMLLKRIRQYDSTVYGIDARKSLFESITSISDKALLPRLLSVLASKLTEIGGHARQWTEYFELWAHIAALGPCESYMILRKGVFGFCEELVCITQPREMYFLSPRGKITQEYNLEALGKTADVSRTSIAMLVAELVRHLDFRRDPVESHDEEPRYLKICPPLFRPTTDEWCYWHAGNYQGARIVLDRLIDGTETTADIWYPGEIIKTLLTTKPGRPDEINSIALTLKTHFEDEYPNQREQAFRTLLSFCQFCQLRSKSDELIRQVAYRANELGSEEYPNHDPSSDDILQGAYDYLRFFRRIADLTDVPSAGNSQDTPFLWTVIESTSDFAPNILSCGHESIREGCLHFLKDLIFNHLPQCHADSGRDTRLDEIRTHAVIKLFSACERAWERVIDERSPSMVAKPTLCVLKLCVDWLFTLKEEAKSSATYAETFKEVGAARLKSLCKKFDDVQSQWIAYEANDNMQGDGSGK